MKHLIVSICILALILCLYSCTGFSAVSPWQVEGISMHYMDDHYKDFYYELSPEDVETFLQLYSEAEYAGKCVGELGTQSYHFTIRMKSGNDILVSEHSETGPRVEVETDSGAWFWIDNQELFEYIWALIGKYHTPEGVNAP
jgi:hypothetical protein